MKFSNSSKSMGSNSTTGPTWCRRKITMSPLDLLLTAIWLSAIALVSSIWQALWACQHGFWFLAVLHGGIASILIGCLGMVALFDCSDRHMEASSGNQSL